MNRVSKALMAMAFAVMAASVSAGPVSASGQLFGYAWEARSSIVGVNPTAGSSGGDPRYFPSYPLHSGIVGLVMQYGAGTFVCSGSLLNDRRSILTAAHCVSDGFGTAGPLSTVAYFQPAGGLAPPSDHLYSSPSAVQIGISNTIVHNGYTGEVVDQNDIAILRLAQTAPTWASSYSLYTGNLDDATFSVAGYGGRSSNGGASGVTAGTTGHLRLGENRYDYRLGDSAFNGAFTRLDSNGRNAFLGVAPIEHTFLSDFDNGLAAHDAGCKIAAAVNTGLNGNPSFCDLGLGANEVAIAGGDSGGPGFINGMLASVNSFGLTYGSGFGDVDDVLNTTFGEFSGFVPVGIHLGFIQANLVPAPSSIWLMLGAIPMLFRRRSTVNP